MATGPTGSSTASTNPFLTAGAGGAATPTYTSTTYLTQTSQPDIETMVNSLYQQLTGRNATAQEVQRLGSALLQAERENPGQYTGTTQYQTSGKRAEVTGTQVSAGVNAQAFLSNLIQGTGEAQDYKAATGYFQAMMQSLNEFKGAYNG